MENIKKRLDHLRGEIRKECISYKEIAELQSLAKYIEKSDVELLEWAGVPENRTDEQNKLDNKWHAWQNFISFLSLEETQRVRAFIIGIEKAIFMKGGGKQ